MNKLFSILILGIMLVSGLGFVSAATPSVPLEGNDFVIRNQSDSSDVYFYVNGTTGNVGVPANLTAGYFSLEGVTNE